jgi:peptidoglycan/xylan/chitin deacetylase (PgdA/CDA1 family)
MKTTPDLAYLMYHELEIPGRALCQDEPGYVRYIVRASDFRTQMESVKSSGRLGLSVSEALAKPELPAVVVTFDDGCETDLIHAAPLLRELGFNATFYVTVGFLDRRGYLSRTQLRELSDLGCEIGSHSMTHPYLCDLDQEQLTQGAGTCVSPPPRKRLATAPWLPAVPP